MYRHLQLNDVGFICEFMVLDYPLASLVTYVQRLYTT